MAIKTQSRFEFLPLPPLRRIRRIPFYFRLAEIRARDLRGE